MSRNKGQQKRKSNKKNCFNRKETKETFIRFWRKASDR